MLFPWNAPRAADPAEFWRRAYAVTWVLTIALAVIAVLSPPFSFGDPRDAGEAGNRLVNGILVLLLQNVVLAGLLFAAHTTSQLHHIARSLSTGDRGDGSARVASSLRSPTSPTGAFVSESRALPTSPTALAAPASPVLSEVPEPAAFQSLGEWVVDVNGAPAVVGVTWNGVELKAPGPVETIDWSDVLDAKTTSAFAVLLAARGQVARLIEFVRGPDRKEFARAFNMAAARAGADVAL